MRREGYIIEEVVKYSNMSESFDQVLRGTVRKKSRQGSYLLAHREEVISELSMQIASGTYRVSGYRERIIVENGKERHIQVLTMKDRIAVHAIMKVVDMHLKRRFIRTTSASIQGRGMHDLLTYIRCDMREDPDGTQYCYKFDIRKFYESVKQDFVMYCVRRVFKDEKLLTMLDNFVRMMPEGLSIGLRSSQGLGNLLLSVFLDHYLKDKYGVRYFYRYCDDGVVLGKTKMELWKIRDVVHSLVGDIGLTVKPNERVFPVCEGIDFLGYVIYDPDHVRIRKRIKQKVARKLHKVKSRKRRKVLIASFYGMAKHADCRTLLYKLTGKKMADFVKLKDTGIQPMYQDGKKRFRGREMNLADLIGEEFVILDFETGVITRSQKKDYEEKVEKQQKELDVYIANEKTPPEGFCFPSNVPLPQGKYVMSILRNPGKANEETIKVWTGDKDNWSMLEQLKEKELLGKILCTVISERCKGFTRYILN